MPISEATILRKLNFEADIVGKEQLLPESTLKQGSRSDGSFAIVGAPKRGEFSAGSTWKVVFLSTNVIAQEAAALGELRVEFESFSEIVARREHIVEMAQENPARIDTFLF